MKHFYTLLLTALLPLSLGAQVVTTSPAIVQRSSSPIIVTFHADKGNKGLMGLNASTPVYAHTGVILEGSESWSNAPTWGDNSDKYRMTYVSANTWQIAIPSIDEFYGLKSGQKVKFLAFVFRNANGSKEGKTDTNGDIFVPVESDGFAMSMTSNAETTLLSGPQTVTFTVNTTYPAEIQLFENNTDGIPFATVFNATTLVSDHEISKTGTTTIIAKATSGADVATEQMRFFIAGAPVAQNYPGGVPKMGPVKNTDGSVTFCLGAPGKSSAMILGSWNDFEYESSQMMKYQDYQGNRYFWVTVPALADGSDHIYYFLVDNKIKVGDPYAQLVLDPYNDRYIPASVFPNMPEYPTEYVQNVPIAIYNSAANAYDWEVKDFKGVDQSALVIYELLVRDFTGTEGKANANGTIAGVLSKLDYLQRLGVNAIELLPIMEFNGNNSWGYNTNFYFAPDKAYGTPDDYRHLIDECHKRGMAVILDIVFNQSDGLHPWYQMYDIARNPFYNGTAPHSYSVLNDWNQDNPLVQQQWKDALKYWLKEYKVDGFRFDLVKGLGTNQSYKATYNSATNTYTNVTEAKTNEYNASRVARMKELHNAMREVNPDAYFINENLAGAKEENEMAQDGEINWANINEASCQFAMGYSSDSNMNRFYAPLDSRTWGSTVSYAESHDEERMAYKINRYGVSGVKGNVEMSMRRLGSVAAIMLVTPGAHMIWQFQEFGADQTTKNSDGGNNTDPKKVIWSYLDDSNRKGLMECYSVLCKIRERNPELFTESASTVMGCNTNNWNNGRFITVKKGDKALYLVVNPQTNNSINVTLNGASASGQYQLLSSSYNVEPKLQGNSVNLPAGAYALYGTPNVVAGINNVFADKPSSSVRVYGDTGRIIINGDYRSYNIYNASGAGVVSKENLSPGLYIVVVDGTPNKVIVK